MKANLRRITVLVLAVLMLASMFAGCSKDNTVTKETSSVTQQTTTAVDTQKNDWEIDTSPITLTFFSDITENPDSEFTSYWGKNPVTKKITEDTGVTPEVMYAPDDTHQKINMLIASNDLPDIVMECKEEQEKQMIKNGMVWELGELSKTAAPNFMSLVPENVMLKSKLAMNDPGYYKILTLWSRPEITQKYGLAKNPAGPTIALEVYEEFGKPEIKTGDDYINFLKQVLAKYPDMIVHAYRSGSNDAYGNPQLERVLMPFGGMKYFYEADGKARLFYDDPAFVDVIKFANSLYTQKLVFQDEFVADSTVRRGNLTAGKVVAEISEDYDNLVYFGDQLKAGVGGTHGNSTFIMLDAFKINPDRGPVFKAETYSGEKYGFLISKKSKNADRAIRFLEYMMFNEDTQKMMMFGIEGKHYDMVNGEPVLRQEYCDAYKTDALKCRSEEGLMYLHEFRNSEWQSRMYGQVFGMPDYVIEALGKTNKYAVDQDMYDGITAYPQDSEELKIQTNIKDYYTQEIIKIIIGAPSDVESRLSALVQKLKDLGLEKLNDFANKSYIERQNKIKEFSKK